MSLHHDRSENLKTPQDMELQADPRYRRFFELFNTGKYFEAHDVLEGLWLPLRHTSQGDFFKGLIQVAGAFVHVRKDRPGPAMSLLRLARGNLEPYAPSNHGVAIPLVVALIKAWESELTSNPGSSRLVSPRLEIPQ